MSRKSVQDAVGGDLGTSPEVLRPMRGREPREDVEAGQAPSQPSSGGHARGQMCGCGHHSHRASAVINEGGFQGGEDIAQRRGLCAAGCSPGLHVGVRGSTRA